MLSSLQRNINCGGEALAVLRFLAQHCEEHRDDCVGDQLRRLRLVVVVQRTSCLAYCRKDWKLQYK